MTALKKENLNSAKVGNDYRIKSVELSTNGHKELYFDVEWDGNEPDYYELRVFDKNRNCLECMPYASHKQRIVVMDFYTDLESKKVNHETFYVELGVAEYSDTEELVKWEALATYEPIRQDIYYESRLFRKNVLELR
ncbi:MAG: hypothetical protein IKJ95_08935 [Bacteroidaceae bacterium]|nr:hypothetical protein [Bacteroidaceae bacterium]